MTREQSPGNQQRYLLNSHLMVAPSVKTHMIVFSWRSLGVSFRDSAAFCPYSLPLVVSIGDAVIPHDEAAKPGFWSLKDTLSIVCVTYTVCLQFVAKNPSLTRRLKETVVITSKVKCVLSRVNVLEESFDSRPSDREEVNRRFDVIQYVVISPVVPGAGLLSVSLRSSKNDCGLLL